MTCKMNDYDLKHYIVLIDKAYVPYISDMFALLVSLYNDYIINSQKIRLATNTVKKKKIVESFMV